MERQAADITWTLDLGSPQACCENTMNYIVSYNDITWLNIVNKVHATFR
jgi:hypothetical protein